MQVLTANRLSDGIVVFLGAGNVWCERIEDARVLATGDAAAAALEKGVADAAARIVVDPYLIDVKPAAVGVAPVRLRERIRAAGPTVRRDLGKQAEPALRRFETAA